MLDQQGIESRISLIKSGNEAAREQLLKDFQPYVLNIAENLCGRKLEWGKDDELSIGLIALNEAIDRYSEDRGVPFKAFLGIVVRSRLKDYFRREKKQFHIQVSFQSEDDINLLEINRAWEIYNQERIARERGAEIIEYRKILKSFGISFDDLVKLAPKRKDYRNQLINAACELARQPKLSGYLFRNKRLPLNELSELSGIRRKVLEKGRKYIIAVALIFYHGNRFEHLRSYLKVGCPGLERDDLQ